MSLNPMLNPTKTLTLTLALALLLGGFTHSEAQEAAKPEPLRIIAFGAHPDDAEFQFGGCAAKWAALGHQVKLVSAEKP